MSNEPKIAADLTGFDKKIEQVTHQLGQIDILINNAAITLGKSFFDIEQADWDQQMNTNVKGVFFLSQAVAKSMKERKQGGSIINVAAVNGEKIRKNNIVYGASKAAVIHLTKSMAYELIDYNIRVNAISLGLFASEPVRDFIDTNAKAQDYIARIPAKRVGKLDDLAGPMLLLVSDASSYMYGSVIKVDGGFSIDVFMDIEL
jgi:NAD(P)-dependent dehydrogenase (short-subunit alcohol dehydrogenase family)